MKPSEICSHFFHFFHCKLGLGQMRCQMDESWVATLVAPAMRTALAAVLLHHLCPAQLGRGQSGFSPRAERPSQGRLAVAFFTCMRDDKKARLISVSVDSFEISLLSGSLRLKETIGYIAELNYQGPIGEAMSLTLNEPRNQVATVRHDRSWLCWFGQAEGRRVPMGIVGRLAHLVPIAVVPSLSIS